jgi:DNA-binding NarL/FixJ family response regulator
MIRIALVEDQLMFRSSIAHLLKTQLSPAEVAEFGDGAEFLSVIQQSTTPDLVLLDIHLPGEDGITLVPKLRERCPQMKIVLLSSIREDYMLYRALQSDVDGYVHKDDSPEVLIQAIKTVLSGDCFFGKTVQQLRRELGSNPSHFNKLLSQKEQQVLELLGQGMTNEEVAPMLALSAETVQTHRRNIMRKLNLHTASQLQAYALKRGFTSISELR